MAVRTSQDAYKEVSKIKGTRSISEIQVSPDCKRIKDKSFSARMFLVTFNSIPFFVNSKLKENEIIAVLDGREVFLKRSQ